MTLHFQGEIEPLLSAPNDARSSIIGAALVDAMLAVKNRHTIKATFTREKRKRFKTCLALNNQVTHGIRKARSKVKLKINPAERPLLFLLSGVVCLCGLYGLEAFVTATRIFRLLIAPASR